MRQGSIVQDLDLIYNVRSIKYDVIENNSLANDVTEKKFREGVRARAGRPAIKLDASV